jgi:hypothetical protein
MTKNQKGLHRRESIEAFIVFSRNIPNFNRVIVFQTLFFCKCKRNLTDNVIVYVNKFYRELVFINIEVSSSYIFVFSCVLVICHYLNYF